MPSPKSSASAHAESVSETQSQSQSQSQSQYQSQSQSQPQPQPAPSSQACDECPHLQCGGKNIALVKRLAEKLITEEEAYFVSELFKALSDMTRVRILFALIGGEMCVCDLQELVGVTQSAVSHQLRTLKQAGLVRYRREGKSLYYSIADDHVSTMLATGLEHISE